MTESARSIHRWLGGCYDAQPFTPDDESLREVWFSNRGTHNRTYESWLSSFLSGEIAAHRMSRLALAHSQKSHVELSKELKDLRGLVDAALGHLPEGSSAAPILAMLRSRL